MAKLALNKSSLSKEKQRKVSYGRYLPSLEMKQKQLLAERKKAQELLASHREDIDRVQNDVYQRLPMLSLDNLDMANLIKVQSVKLEEENLLGIKLPFLADMVCERAQYGYLARPHWFDEAANSLEKVLRLKLEEQVLGIRLEALEAAVRTVTQRVNLFSKVLIPEANSNMKRIGLFLADQERAGVVRSKLAKRKNQEE